MDKRPNDAPEWIWYGEVDGKPVVTFGRWPKHGAVWRYKWADIQPAEHDHPVVLPKRPFAFAVKRAPENGADQWRLFMDEGAAREAAEQLDGEYEALFRVGDRRYVVENRHADYKRAWNAYVEMSMNSENSTFDCIKAAVDAARSRAYAGRASATEMQALVAAIIQDEAKYDPATNTWDVEKAAADIVAAFETA